MKKYLFGIILLIHTSITIFSQNRKTIEIEVNGRPTWQQIIPLGKDGLILFVKSDVTKAQIVKFDKDLNKLWESEIFLDAEKEPTAYTLDNEQVTFMFSENQGMYYQVFKINLKNGKFDNKGFELREFFQDQDYAYLGNRVLMAGANEKGATFYNYKFDEGFGEFISAELNGTAQVQLFKYQPEKNTIETLWSIKEMGYKDEKKKKGGFTKDAYVVYAKYDTTGKLIVKQNINSIAGNFPMTAKLTEIDENTKAITGTFQSNAGAKGLFITVLKNGTLSPINFIDYKDFLKGNPNLTDEEVKKIADNHYFLSLEPVYGNNLISVGGVFFRPDYQTITRDNPYYNPYGFNDPYGRNTGRFGNNGFNQPRTQSSQVFRGYYYLNGFVASLDLNGSIVFQNKIEMNQISPQINETLAIAENKSVAYCIKGNIGVGGVTNLSNPFIYKLSEDKIDSKNQQFIANYNGIKFWYENNFIAIGNRIKYEAVKMTDDLPEEKPSKRKKNQKQTPPQANIKKIIYLSKIEGGGN